METPTRVPALTFIFFSVGILAGCATESSRILPVAQVAAASLPPAAMRMRMAVGNFDNRSSFLRGIFSDGIDSLGEQSKTILVTHLQQTNRFDVLDQENLQALKQEAEFKGAAMQFTGADFVVTGNVNEFGRREVGDQQLFGIFGRSDLAIREAVDKLAAAIDSGQWKTVR